MKSFSLNNEILNRLPIFGRTFIPVLNKGLVCSKLDKFIKGNASSLPNQKSIHY